MSLLILLIISISFLQCIQLYIQFNSKVNTANELLSSEEIKEFKTDIFITTLNDPIKLLEKTISHAKNVTGHRHVYVLDDGNNQEVRNLAKVLNVQYLSRDNLAGAKAGNLNNALKQTENDYFVLLDSDNIIPQDYIFKNLPYFMDKNVAIVQTGQRIIRPSYAYFIGKWCDPFWYFHIFQPFLNQSNAAVWCGGGSIVKREFITSIPEETITEDFHLSLKILASGKKVVFNSHSEIEAYGPYDYKSFIIQRGRWMAGILKSIYLMRSEFYQSKYLSLKQKFIVSLVAIFYLTILENIIIISLLLFSLKDLNYLEYLCGFVLSSQLVSLIFSNFSIGVLSLRLNIWLRIPYYFEAFSLLLKHQFKITPKIPTSNNRNLFLELTLSTLLAVSVTIILRGADNIIYLLPLLAELGFVAYFYMQRVLFIKAA